MTILKTLSIVSLYALLAGCSSTPDRRDPPPDRRDPPPDRQARGGSKASGTFVKPVGLLFVSMDLNFDRIVSGDEAASGIAAEWAAIGPNTSAAYFSSWSQSALGSTDALPTFMSFDRDMNGVVTEVEFSERLSAEFHALDKNQDGQVTRGEMLIAFEAPRGRERGQESGGRGERGQRGGGRPPR